MMLLLIPRIFNAAALVAAFFLLALLACGCNEYERRGISPLPQNRPASWETNPYGNSMRN